MDRWSLIPVSSFKLRNLTRFKSRRQLLRKAVLGSRAFVLNVKRCFAAQRSSSRRFLRFWTNAIHGESRKASRPPFNFPLTAGTALLSV